MGMGRDGPWAGKAMTAGVSVACLSSPPLRNRKMEANKSGNFIIAF